MKCSCCGTEEFWQVGRKLGEAEGEEATEQMVFKNDVGTVTREVCHSCAMMLRSRGWKSTKEAKDE